MVLKYALEKNNLFKLLNLDRRVTGRNYIARFEVRTPSPSCFVEDVLFNSISDRAATRKAKTLQRETYKDGMGVCNVDLVSVRGDNGRVIYQRKRRPSQYSIGGSFSPQGF
ncbi:hypothetical protein HY450_04110 [Candidatus Pacearchaeota archaeon]|nr:hypothetical protein [Candidatus Pacearchaeota archaeon]